ncbi:MAG: hypothetical protein ACREXY_23860, partial [Gammaproteobacteria bacterium]
MSDTPAGPIRVSGETERSWWQPIETAPLVQYGESPVEVLLYGREIGIKQGRALRLSDGYLFAGVSYINGNLADGSVTH